MHCRLFSSIPGLYALDANSTYFPVVTTENVFRDCQVTSGGQNCPRFGTPGLGADWLLCGPQLLLFFSDHRPLIVSSTLPGSLKLGPVPVYCACRAKPARRNVAGSKLVFSSLSSANRHVFHLVG